VQDNTMQKTPLVNSTSDTLKNLG